MKWSTLFVLFSVAYVEALECGIGSVDNSLKQAIVSCLSRNMTLNDIFDFTTLTSEETVTVTTENTETTTEMSSGVNSTSRNRKKFKRVSREAKETKDRETTTTVEPKNETDVESATTEEPTSTKRNCIIHCVLSDLDLTDKDGYPEHQRVEDELMKNAKGRELKDFLRDTTDRCFQKINDESTKDACEFSLELVKCLADSGKSNCGDWPAGDISLFNS